MGTNSGTFTLTYNMQTVPDELTVYYEGEFVWGTDGLVSGSDTVQLTFNGASNIVQFTLSAPNSGTAWSFFASCPVPTTTPPVMSVITAN